MVDRKYNNILTGVLVVVVLAIIGVLGFYGYQTFKEYGTQKENKAAVDEFDSNVNKLNNNTQRPVETQDQGNASTNGGSFDFEKILNSDLLLEFSFPYFVLSTTLKNILSLLK